MNETRELPNDIEAELNVLASVILNNGLFLTFIKKEFFYQPGNKILWKAFSVLKENKAEIDLVNLSEYFRRREMDGKQNLFWSASNLADLTKYGLTVDAFIESAKILIDTYVRREMILRLMTLIDLAHEKGVSLDELAEKTRDIARFGEGHIVYIAALDLVVKKLAEAFPKLAGPEL